MRSSFNCGLIVVLLSAFLGPAGAVEGRIRDFQRPAGGQKPAPTPAPGQTKPAPTPAPGQTKPVQDPPLQPSADAPAPGNPVVIMSTSLGDITIELFKTEAP